MSLETAIATDVVSEIKARLRSKKTTSLEKERCRRELAVIAARLQSGEYLQSNFKERALLNILDRTDELFKDLNFFWSVGAIWSELFSKLKIDRHAKILDLACGFFPKVELGLLYYGFKGNVTLVDIDHAALLQAEKFLNFFSVPFSIKRMSCSIWKLPSKQYQLIVGNHLIDDVLLERFSRLHAIRLSETYTSEALFMKMWEQIIANDAFGIKIMQELADMIMRLLAPGGIVVFVDYPSFSHRALHLQGLINYVSARRNNLRDELRLRGMNIFNPIKKGSLTRERLVVKQAHIVCGRKNA